MNKTSLGTIIASIGVIIILALMGVATYAYFGLEIEGEGKDMTIQTFNKNMEITYTDTSNVTLVNAYTGESISKTFTVKNTGDVDVYYNVVLENVVNNFEVPDELVYTITETGGNASRLQTAIPTTDSTLLSDIKITAGDTHYYVMQITFLEKDTDQSYNMNKTFSSNINIVPSSNSSELMKQNTNTLGYKVLESAIDGSSILTYNAELQDGAYFTNNNINGDRTIYLKGSNSLDNNVFFGGFCWKIVRSNVYGNVRLIYNGVLTDGVCINATGENASIGSSTFNDSANYNAYVGYMYGSPNSASYSDEHKNTNSSKIKTLLENWYANNLSKYSNYIENDIYCNNRSMNSFKVNNVKYSTDGYGNLNTGYQSKYNISIKQIPSYDCPNISDRFSVKSGLNTYPVGLLTAEEAMFAGINESSNLNNNYLYIGDTYWTMSPAYFNGTNAYNYVVQNGKLNVMTVNSNALVRPVITLKNSVKLLNGNGSLTSPYRVTE